MPRSSSEEEEEEEEDELEMVEIDCGEDDDEEDLFMQIEMSDVLKIQLSLIKELDNMIFDSFEEHQQILENAKEIVEMYNAKKSEMADELRFFMKRFRRIMKMSNQQAQFGVNEFRKSLREVLTLYVEVNNRMKMEEKGVIKQDAFIAQIEKNLKEWNELKENIQKLNTELFQPAPPPLPTVLPSTTTTSLSYTSTSSYASSSSFSESNHTENTPNKPVETEKNQSDLPLPSKKMDPVKEQGQKLAGMSLAENPPKTVEQYVASLPRKQRD